MTEAIFWTPGRVLRWCGLFLLLVLGVPLVVGLTSAWLHRVDPATDWRLIGRAVAMTLCAAGMIGGTIWLWRGYRSHAMAHGGATWEARATTRRLTVSSVWRDAMLAGFVVGIASAFASQMPPGGPRTALAVIASLALIYGILRSTVHYMNRIDEQERDANLWGTYWGMTVYVTLYFAHHVAGRFGIAVPHAHDLIFLVSVIVTAAAFLWKRFR